LPIVASTREGRATWTFLGSLEELRPARGRQL
jgi:hypothetical protein